MGQIFFSADHHFSHDNIRRFCDRPFPSIEAHDEALIEKWNQTIGPKDTVWHLGDFAYRIRTNRLQDIFSELKGREKHLIRGNHDSNKTCALPWTSVNHYHELKIHERKIVLFHYAQRTWNGMRRGALMLYGHSHNTLPGFRTNWESATLDVGVDAWEYRPVSLEEILEKIEHLPSQEECITPIEIDQEKHLNSLEDPKRMEKR